MVKWGEKNSRETGRGPRRAPAGRAGARADARACTRERVRALRARGAAPSRFLANFSPSILPQPPPRRKSLFTKNLQIDLYNLLDKFYKQDYN